MQNKVLQRPCYNRSGPQMDGRMHVRSSVDNTSLGGQYDYDGRVCFHAEGTQNKKVLPRTLPVRTALIICGIICFLYLVAFVVLWGRQASVRGDIQQELTQLNTVQQDIVTCRQTIQEGTTMSSICSKAAKDLGMVSNEGVVTVYIQAPAAAAPAYDPLPQGEERAKNF